jgi:hypothetical protein
MIKITRRAAVVRKTEYTLSTQSCSENLIFSIIFPIRVVGVTKDDFGAVKYHGNFAG